MFQIAEDCMTLENLNSPALMNLKEIHKVQGWIDYDNAPTTQYCYQAHDKST